MDEYQDIKDMLKPRRMIGASARLRQRVTNASVQKHNVGNSTRWLWGAAACVALLLCTTMLFKSQTSMIASGNNDCIVYVAGQKAFGEEAQAIAEADVARMEQFMRTVAQQNEVEREKFNQFMQQTSQQK